ncbi:MAG: arginine--tRNA ligase [Candidatus Kerfeldbacteria bacterium]|nr:arginine--tRNA ligase [Candidatus Kerfeldbacteria bacterium]
MTTRELISRQVARAIQAVWPGTVVPHFSVDYPREVRHGEYATNVAMQLAPVLRQNPMEIAERIAVVLRGSPLRSRFARVDAAPPGFLNFELAPTWLARLPTRILEERHRYGRNDAGKNKRIHVEFISANPTGPLHMGNGRGAFIGDALANVLAASGYRVWREYYFNDRGAQAERLAESVIRKYFIQHGVKVDYPENCYQGEYVGEIAASLKLERVKVGDIEKLRARIQQRVLNAMTRDIQQLIEKRLHIRFDRWFRESELFGLKLDRRILTLLRERGLVYDQDGATWMKTSAFGDDKDRVIVKSDGRTTYFFGDVAYVYDKFMRRKFDRALILLGADHHGFMPRLKAAAAALDRPGKLDVLIYQLVRLIRGGVEIRMSKRAGTFVTLDELIDEVGPDVARFFFLMVGPDTHMDFDLDLAKEQSEKNPVYYVQYAHARIASILREIAKRRVPDASGTRTATDAEGLALATHLLRFPETVIDVAHTSDVQKLPFYAIELADRFHRFYATRRVIERDRVHVWRLQLVRAAQTVLANVLHLMGVTAPEKM